VEGALAPDPNRSRVEPLREIPGLKKRERTWKDEVRDRVRDRRRQRSSGDLPLFDDPDDVDEAEEDAGPEDSAAEPVRSDRASAPPAPSEPDLGWGSSDSDAPAEEPDLPLRGPDPLLRGADPILPSRTELRLAGSRPLVEEPPEAADRWALGDDVSDKAGPVERPAYAGERLRAALVDLAILVPIWVVVVYFAGRAARVPMAGLLPTWPYLLGYMTLLGVLYAAVFTGTTGQTVGKIATGLRVVDVEGRPPRCARSAVRALLGTAGILLAGLGLVPMFVDPARRAAHDRLLRTRVIRG
jgi:uncharacterized RDD family membrane protein YckC